MKLSSTSQALLADLAAMAKTLDPALGEQLTRLLPLGSGVVSVRLLELVTELSVELSRTLPAGRIEVRMASADAPELVYVETEPPAAPAGDDGEQARLTLRLPQGLKEQAERAAGAAGMSLNAWLVKEVADAVGRRSQRGGHRLTGYGRA